MKTLIAVKSCARDAVLGSHSQIEKSWGKFVRDRADLVFFLGKTAAPFANADDVVLDVPDGYDSVALKVNGIFQWALARSYDHVVLVDTDTFIIPDRLFAVQFGDYTGWLLPWGPFMFGGCGYALSERAMRTVIGCPIQHPLDDRSIGMILKDTSVRVAQPRWNRYVGWHFPKNTYGCGPAAVEWQHMMAEQHLGGAKRLRTRKVVIGGGSREVVLELCGEDRNEV